MRNYLAGLLALLFSGAVMAADCVDNGNGTFTCSVDSFTIPATLFRMKRQNRDLVNRDFRSNNPLDDSAYFSAIVSVGVEATSATTGVRYFDRETELYTSRTYEELKRRLERGEWEPDPYPEKQPGETSGEYMMRVILSSEIPLVDPPEEE